MTKSMKDILEQALQLSESERSELAEQLFQSVDPRSDKVREAWDSETKRRSDDLKNGRVKAVPLAEVKRRLQQIAEEAGSSKDV